MKQPASLVTTQPTVRLLDGQSGQLVPLAQRVDLLFALGSTTSRTALAAAIITFLLFVPFGTSPALWAWLGLVASTNLLRLGMFVHYRRNSTAYEVETWLRLHLWSAVATGICWGLLPLHPTDGLDSAYAALVVVIPIAIAAGAISAYSVFPAHFSALLASIFGTTLVCDVWQQGSSAVAAAVIFGFIAVALWNLARRYQGQMYSEMQMRDQLQTVNERLSETNRELARHQQHLESERELAAHIHLSLTAGSDRDISNVKVWSKPVSSLSGDLILTVRNPDERVYLFLGDFTGHGLPAALGAVPATHIFLTMARKGIDIETIAAELHTRLSSLLPVGYFCCAALVCADTSLGEIRVVNAGLPPLLLKRRADNAVVEFASKYTPFGVGDETVQPGNAVQARLADGDSLFIYTDGIIELTNAHDEQWGIPRLSAFVAEDCAEGSSIARLQQVCEAFTEGTPAADDISVIEFRAGEPAKTAARADAPC